MKGTPDNAAEIITGSAAGSAHSDFRRIAEGFLEADRLLSADVHVGLQEALQLLVDLAVDCVQVCNWAAITVWPVGEAPWSQAISDDIARRVEAIQYEQMEGPCLRAAKDESPIKIEDLANDGRWPRFAAAVLAELPVRSVLAFPLGSHPHRMALNLFSASTSAFTDSVERVAENFATQAKGLLLHAQTAERAAHYSIALETNRQIAMAVGILMARQGIRSDEALAQLKAQSNRHKRKVRDVAAYVVEAGELPDGPFQ